MVSGDRPQSAEVRAQHLPGRCIGFRSRDAARLLLLRSALAYSSSSHAVRQEGAKTKKARDDFVIPGNFVIRSNSVITSGAGSFAKRKILRSRGTCCSSDAFYFPPA